MQERRSTAMARAPLVPLCLAAAALLLANAAAPCSAKTTVTIEEACRRAASSHPGVSYEHCVSSLASDARSREAVDLHNLAVLAARMAVEHAAATEAKIEDLNEVEDSPQASARLHHCLELYNAAAAVLRDALDNLHAHIYGKASEQLAAALGASESCEDVWKGEERVPVAGHDREYGRMALVALGLTSGIV
ncbi:putative invertase inhibitor [Phragmites australis]|uniref:putative invertase inhibitor n=1 Tax=Phragmites australis TaxID=29695 RepID=UPI002D79F56D|nr:putative invertase inhibitor [Phragmites australis]